MVFKKNGTTVGDPMISVGDKFVVLPGYGDFRLSYEEAMTLIGLGIKAKQDKVVYVIPENQQASRKVAQG